MDICVLYIAWRIELSSGEHKEKNSDQASNIVNISTGTQAQLLYVIGLKKQEIRCIPEERNKISSMPL